MESSSCSGDVKDSGSLPPWEKEDIARVPHLASSSPKLSCAEREALPILWAARSNTVSGHRTGVNARTLGGTISPTPSGYDHSSDTQVSDRLPTRAAQSPSTSQDGRSPGTSQDGESWSPTNTSASDSPPTRHEISPMAGTMSSRDVNARTKSRPANGAGGSRHSRSNSTRLQRWKSSVKEMFVHHPVEVGELERIRKRHWTED